ncbi:YqjF family protein [Tengunoibacter tsumagoiensis]|uniref:DUF2071 domain-containing protein n=1 Tax=Tengunoibacter tsumagoiensis TaxID=2014871 RepID=A0A402A6H3_9CHLR|nr:DUF2071 domain-containing protein [Tengunoibacter tsumagoiensis]GCE14743.1 hypothetical protein KTT_46020 [Tengunoibacter tsumagoiensis]
MNASALLQEIAHRSLPLPTQPWVMTQTWQELLFAHWPVNPSILRPLIPELLEIDLFEGEAWVGVVPFNMSNVHPRGLPAVKGLSAFPELNVRTYVRAHGVPGVYFFSLDAGNPIAVAIARSVFHLPYFNAIMRNQWEGERLHYCSHRTHRGAARAEYEAFYRPLAPVALAQVHSIEYWLTERYALYTFSGTKLYRGDIHHIQWPLQLAEAEILQNTMALAQGIVLPDTQPLFHYAEQQEVLVWALQQVSGPGSLLP